MPTLNKVLGLTPKPFQLFFYSNEKNEPPHVHVEHTQGGECKFWLSPEVALVKNWDMPLHQETKALRLVKENREALIQLFEKYALT